MGKENPQAARKNLLLTFPRKIEFDLQNSPTHLVIKQALRNRMEIPAAVHKNTWEEKHLLSVERHKYGPSSLSQRHNKFLFNRTYFLPRAVPTEHFSNFSVCKNHWEGVLKHR